VNEVRAMPQPPSHRRREAPAEAQHVSDLRAWVASSAVKAGAFATECADIALAVSEALSNVVVHAYAKAPEVGSMWVETYVERARFVVEVHDEGGGLRPRMDSPGAGIGLALIAALTEGIEISGGGGSAGARLRMRFALVGLS